MYPCASSRPGLLSWLGSKQLELKQEAASEDGKAVLDPSNWTVSGQEPAAGAEVKTGSTVTLAVAKPEPSAVATGRK